MYVIAYLVPRAGYRFVYFTSGSATLSLPASSGKATARGGAKGLVLATDFESVNKFGYRTVCSKREQTVGMAIPVKGNRVPEHTVVHEGACRREDQDFGK